MVVPRDSGGYHRVNVHLDRITYEGDLWAETDDWIPGNMSASCR